MDLILYIIVACLMVSITIKNFSMISRFKHNKQYIDCYKKVLNDDSDALDCINAYIEKENKDEFINKAKVVKLCYEIKHDLDYQDTLDTLDLRKVFTDKKGNISQNLININSDTFVFIILSMSKAYYKEDKALINKIFDKFDNLPMNKHIEYLVCKNCKDILLGNECDLSVLKSLLDGTYGEYKYDKNIVGLFKKFAACLLSYKNETIEEFFNDDLYNFVKTLIGSAFMKDIHIDEKYLKEEKTEE